MTTEDVIRAGVARCNRIVAGFEELRPFLEPVLPIGEQDMDALDVVQRIASVALLKRYEQLQDMLGRVFRAYLDWELEDVRAMSRRDQANHLEKFGVVDDADRWIDANELRNRLVHEYPVEESEQVDRVNDTWREMAYLIASYARLHGHFQQRGLI